MTSDSNYSVRGSNRRIEGPELVPLSPADDRPKRRSTRGRAKKRRKARGPVEQLDNEVVAEDLEGPESGPGDNGEGHIVDYLA